MFGFSSSRRSANRTPVRRAAAWEPLESRQLLSGVTPAVTSGLSIIYSKDTLPTSVISSTKIKGTVTVSVTNSAAVSDTGVNTFAVYASGDNILDAGDLMLGSVSKKLNLAAGKSITVTIPVKSQPAPAAATYDILTAATNASGTVSTTQATNGLMVAAPFVNLSAAVGVPSPTALTAGKTITVKVTLTNEGNINSTGALTTTIGLSSDGATLTNSLTQQTKNVTVKANTKAVALTFKIKIPAGTTPGTYFPAFTFSQGSDTFTVVGNASTAVTVGSA